MPALPQIPLSAELMELCRALPSSAAPPAEPAQAGCGDRGAPQVWGPQIWGQEPHRCGDRLFPACQPCVSRGRATKPCPGFVPGAQPSHVSLCFRPGLPAVLSSSALHHGVHPLCPRGHSAAGEDGQEIPGAEGERKMWLQEILH